MEKMDRIGERDWMDNIGDKINQWIDRRIDSAVDSDWTVVWMDRIGGQTDENMDIVTELIELIDRWKYGHIRQN